jgi:hypothetical protein
MQRKKKANKKMYIDTESTIKKRQFMRRCIDLLRVERKEMMYEKKYKYADNTNIGDGKKGES